MIAETLTQKTKISKLEQYDRNYQMYNLRLKGLTYEQIGLVQNPKISRQRVHQIILKFTRKYNLPFYNLPYVKFIEDTKKQML